MSAAYADYIDDVYGFFRSRYSNVDQFLRDCNGTISLWKAAVVGWNDGIPAAQVAATWHAALGKPIQSSIPAKILASREARRLVWKCAQI